MKQIKWTLGINTILLLIFAGCSADEPIEKVQNDDRVEIRVSSGISSSVEPLSRTVLDGMINTTFSSDLDVAFARADANNARATYDAYETLNGTVSTSKVLSFAPPAYYLANGYKTKLVGWYPRRDGVTFTATETGGTVSFGTIDGKTDMMATTLKVGDKATQISSLSFSHLLTQICVKAYAIDAAAQTLWGQVKSVKITGKAQTCTLTLPAVTADDDTKATVTFGTSDTDLELVNANPANNVAITWPIDLGVGSTNAVTTGYAMFAPVTTGNSIELQIELAAGVLQKKTISAPATDGFKPGYSYVITLKFTSTDISPTVSITDWVTGDAGDEVEI